MNGEVKQKGTKRKKLYSIIALSVFIIIAFVFLFQMDIIRDLIGFEGSISINFTKILTYMFSSLGIIGLIIGIYFAIKFAYGKAPLQGELISSDKLKQKKKFFPRFRVTHIMKVKGMPRKFIEKMQNEDSSNELLYLRNWDVISSLAQVCDEISFWVVKNNNQIQIFFTISGWSWFSKEKASTKANNSVLSFKAAFNNIYPSILFENASLQDSKILFNVISKCDFGLLTKGIPALKTNQTQIDRLINTFSSTGEDCFFVTSFSGVRKGTEKRQNSKTLSKREISSEFDIDFTDSKKTGQSKIGAYAFSETENGMHTILAALLSVWSGTHTFDVEKLGKCTNKTYYKRMQKLNPIKNTRLSNKALSSFIHLPEKPFLTEDTGQPVFEIPSQREEVHQEILIGNIVQNDRILDDYTLPLDNFLFNTEIVGMIGRGKSYLVASIIEQLLNKNIGCLVFDLKGEYAEFFVNDPDVFVYTIGNPAPLGINLFQMDSNDDVQNILALVCEMLTIAGTPFSPTMLNIFESALQMVTKKDVKNLEVFMQCLYQSSEEYSSSMKTSYSRDSIDAILNRLNYIFGGVNYEVFSVMSNTLDFSMLDQGQKIILDFSEYLRRGANTASLFLVCNLILHLLSKHASQKGITNSLRYLVILEEAMYLIPKRFNLDSTASIGYSEQNFITGRSLGIGTITIYQLWNSVSSVVHANSLTKILFRGEETEKIRNAIVLTDEQFNYLPHLPDRNFILKSKSLSGPALMKTKTFERKPYSKNDYQKLAKEKFNRSSFKYEKISRSLLELRKNIFEKRGFKPQKSHFDRVSEELTKAEETANTSEKPRKRRFNNYSWEWCINICPIRFEHKDKNSNWIKENICLKMQDIAQEISMQLMARRELGSLIDVFEKNPNYITEKILEYYNGHFEDLDPKLLTFCTINLILSDLKKEFNLSNAWKNNSLAKIKSSLKDKSISKYPIH
jgi:hypothetical protein